MADVINLGQMGQRRESVLSGVPEAISTGIQLGQKSRETAAKENQYKTELATLERQKLEKSRGFFKDTMENLGIQYSKLKTPKEIEAFEQSDAYQSGIKMANMTIGGEKVGAGWYDKETKKLMLPTPLGMAKERMSRVHAGLVEKAATSGRDSLTENEAYMFDLFNKNPSIPEQAAASMLKDPTANKMMMLDTPASKSFLARLYMNKVQWLLKGSRGVVARAGGQYSQGLANVTAPVDNETNPLNLELGE